MEGGLDLEKQTSIPVEAELFFLTSLFIELVELCEEVCAKSRCEMSSSGRFGVRMEGLNRLLSRVVNLK